MQVLVLNGGIIKTQVRSTSDGLPVFQLDIHVNGLLLQAEDFRGDGSEVRLEVEEHFLHAAQQRVALDDLREKNIKC